MTQQEIKSLTITEIAAAFWKLMNVPVRLSRLSKYNLSEEEDGGDDEYKKCIAYWNSVPILDEKDVSQGEDDLVAKMYITPGSSPFHTAVDAIFHGHFGGVGIDLGIISADGGIVRGKDRDEIKIIGFETENRLAMWGETRNNDIFLDTHTYLDYCYENRQRVLVGGRIELDNRGRGADGQPKPFPGFKIELVRMESQNQIYLDHILTEQYNPKQRQLKNKNDNSKNIPEK